MEVNFYYQPRLEYDRLLSLYYNLAHRIYQDYGFIVLPYPISYPKSVFIPEIKGFKPSDYLGELRNLTPDLLTIPLQKAPNVTKLKKVLKEKGFRPQKVNRQRCQQLEEKWQLIQPLFEDYFFDLFPQFRQHNIQAEVYWSCYGTLVSFGFRKTKGKTAKIKIYLRQDSGLASLAEGFLSAFFLKDFWQKKYTFSQREAVIDFLLEKTKLNRLFPDFSPTLTLSPQKQSLVRYYKESIAYLRRLGFYEKQALSLSKDGRVLIGGQLPRYPFTTAEEAVLKTLLATPNEPVSYYELGDVLWGDDVDRFSLWALSRLIFKIRHKLRKNGLSPDHIKNLRGRGYYYTPQP